MPVDKETAVKIERDVLRYLDSVKKEQGLTDEKWGEQAFQGRVNGRRKIQNLKGPQANGQPQKLCIADFVCLCSVLRIEPSRVLSKALEDNGL